MVRFLKKWRYLGIETPQLYRRTLLKMYQVNLQMVRYISLTAILLLLPTSFYPLLVLHDRIEFFTHYASALLMLLFYLGARQLQRHPPMARVPWIYPGLFVLYMHIFAAFGIYDSVFTNLTNFGVSIYLLMMCVQYAFVLSPIISFVTLVLDCTVYLLCAYFIKTWDIFLVDLIYCIMSFILSLVISWLVAHLRVRHLLAEEALSTLNGQLYERSVTDALTGLHNRRQFTEETATRIVGHTSAERYIATVLFDVDFFKQYNDFYGHAQGDTALYEVAQCLLGFRRKYGISLCRWGGEEFMALLLTDSPDFAIRIADEMCTAVRDLRLEHARSAACPYLTLSGGLYLAPTGENTDWNELYRKADQALYRAKSCGRNRICIIRKEDGDALA